ncbi:Hok/Gef family protein [Enterobacter bugandensis]|uniref:Hok/Gef family protein n=1 Tax=Enterobacter sp. TaxID=42895 RepID=UPI0031DBB080
MTPLKAALGIVLIICLTIVIFTFITRGRLCELSIKGEHQEVAAKLACITG